MTTGEPVPYESGRDQAGPGAGGPHDTPGAAGRARRRPRGWRRFLPLIVAAFLVLEIWLLTVLADLVGVGGVLLVLLGGVVLGSVVIKRAGRRAWSNLTATIQQGSGTTVSPPPPRGMTGGGNALAMLGGLLLMFPGLLTDVAGVLCVLPPTAALVRRLARRSLSSSGLGDAVQQVRRAQEQANIHRPDGKIVQGEVLREDNPDRGDARD
ncbi:FxsA family protein [Streptomyces sp. OF3]|uniref:FxsA family protein n=1 Tax=Streptomyces alkaliterrae TaxID=2213162 RepID=A0A7W3WPD5_9ACTN|nr:FxsA family membrane protein [Streptomyces alkaliterrae]MBB1255989.1 FxsA family protein [Streptomyces alkaliterrae]